MVRIFFKKRIEVQCLETQWSGRQRSIGCFPPSLFKSNWKHPRLVLLRKRSLKMCCWDAGWLHRSTFAFLWLRSSVLPWPPTANKLQVQRTQSRIVAVLKRSLVRTVTATWGWRERSDQMNDWRWRAWKTDVAWFGVALNKLVMVGWDCLAL